jgi:hypothetical protein
MQYKLVFDPPYYITCGATCNTMGMAAKGTFTRAGRGRTGCIIVPADVVGDTSFPFKYGDKVMVRIEAGRLIVEKQKT